MNTVVSGKRVLSGMRPTGRLHLGHYRGVLRNWLKLQDQYDCFFFIADFHALTTHYADKSIIENSVWDMLIDWLSVGINPGASTLFVQSRVPEHAELHLLLSMMTPIGWLERVPTYKDQQEKLKEKDLSTYGFLGYPLLQSADILIYKAGSVPVGADQVAHVELTREVARRFNFLYGREPDFAETVQQAIKKMGKKQGNLYQSLRKRYQEQGDDEALLTARALVEDQRNITLTDKRRLLGDLEGTGKEILPEPQALLTEDAKTPGLDGQKMSKSYRNTIELRETREGIEQKIRLMPTDPARVRRNDPGNPAVCPVWQFHEMYSTDEVKEWVQAGCRSAGIGCVECKHTIIEAIDAELAPIREKAADYEDNPDLLKSIVADGCETAHEEAKKTLIEVKAAMGLDYG